MIIQDRSAYLIAFRSSFSNMVILGLFHVDMLAPFDMDRRSRIQLSKDHPEVDIEVQGHLGNNNRPFPKKELVWRRGILYEDSSNFINTAYQTLSTLRVVWSPIRKFDDPTYEVSDQDMQEITNLVRGLPVMSPRHKEVYTYVSSALTVLLREEAETQDLFTSATIHEVSRRKLIKP